MAVELIPTVVYSSMMGVVVSSIVRGAKSYNSNQGVYLFALLVLLLIHILGELYIFTGVYQYAPAIAGFQLPIRMLVGPAFYFYAATAMFAKFKVTTKQRFFALSGPIAILVLMVPFLFFISPEQKLALADPLTRDPNLWRLAVTTCVVTAIVFLVFTFVYLFAAFRLHAKHTAKLMEKYSAIEQRAMDWLKVLLVLWGFIWLVYAINYVAGLLGFKWHFMGAIFPFIELVVLITFTHFALKQIEFFENEEDSELEDKPRETVISHDKMEEISEKLILAMTDKTLYKDEDLSLNRLSKSISVSENYISETLSQYLKTNFFKFVNHYRVEEAKELLTNSDKLVSTIAYDVGFKSKSTFNSAFKTMTGTTPTAFKKALLTKNQTN